MELLTKTEAVSLILEKLRLLRGAEKLNEVQAEFATEKLVSDMLDYCHREDFPMALVYTAVDLVGKRLEDMQDDADSQGISVRSPLSSIKMDDTEFSFAVENVSASGVLSDYDFDSIKGKLNIYRKVVSLP
ncbi:hypothetical protein [Anaerovibrio slackiae]|uniref:hypothetical protein n=1 Tax=Anaerovibrio slackiae TaxID=2652309 RepID=UPI00386B8795